MATRARTGLVVLAIYLIITGLVQLIGLRFEGIGIVQGLLAIVAAVLLLIGK